MIYLVVFITQLISIASASTKCGTTASSSTVAVTKTSSTTYTVSSNGCPGYDWTEGGNTDSYAYEQSNSYSMSLPSIATSATYLQLYTDKAGTTTNSNYQETAIGVAVNGAAIFTNVDRSGKDAWVNEHTHMDACRGHPMAAGIYHYHTEPGSDCVFNDTTGRNVHSPLFGVMFDGIPIYGPYGDNGSVPTDLDDCNGHSDSTYPFYHYHVQYNLTYPYTINCLKGCGQLPGSPSCSKDTTTTNSYNWTTMIDAIQTGFAAATHSTYSNYSSSSSSGGGMPPPSPGAVIGIVIAVLVVVGVIAYCVIKRRRKATGNHEIEMPTEK